MAMPPANRADILADLTSDQVEAVEHGEGPLLILAGAGSGKTRVITRRVAYLLRQGVHPRAILAITFTNKAAGEMRQRIDRLAPGHRVWISTFHSFGARLLREYADQFHIDRHFTIYDMSDRNKLIKDAMDSLGFDNIKFTPDRIGGGISKAKNLLLSPEEYARSSADFFTQTAAHVYAHYQKRLRDANAVDFDDLLFLPALALRHDGEFRSELDSRFRYILVDEYQDTNAAQYEIVRQLSVDFPNLCVVGDPDQSIYSWRNADIRNILDFERDFPDARVIVLDRNYRSTKAILAAASQVIEQNVHRKKKSLVTENEDGTPVQVLTFDNGLDEADLVVKRIRDEVNAGNRRYRDFAIFLRINALTRTLESAFIKHAIPFQIVRGQAFFDRKENRDVLAYLRLLVNPKDDVAFLRIVNEPARGIGKTSLGRLQEFAEPRELSLLQAAAQIDKIPEIRGKAKNGLREFVRMMANLRQHLEASPDEVMRQVILQSGYRQMLLDSRDEEDAERLANIEELITAAQQFAADDPERTISDFLEQVALTGDQDAWDSEQDHVSVMTLHAAKGLEFPVVYILALEQGLLPHERSIAREAEIEEERRLFFVGMTRAMKELNLCLARMREFRGQTLYTVPSMFLEELPKDGVERLELTSATGRDGAMHHFRGGGGPAAQVGWVDAGVVTSAANLLRKAAENDPYKVGTQVEHPEYGVGRITSVSGYGATRNVKIRFAVGGEKTFRLSAARNKLKIVD